MQQQQHRQLPLHPGQGSSSGSSSSRRRSSSNASSNASSSSSRLATSSTRLLGLLLIFAVCSSLPAASARELAAAKAKACKPACAKGRYCISGACKPCSNSGQCKQLLGAAFKCDRAASSATKGQCISNTPLKPAGKVEPPQPPANLASAKCTRDAQCSGEPVNRVCDVGSGKCVQCTAASHCDPLVAAAATSGVASAFNCANNLCMKVAKPLPGPNGAGTDSSDGTTTTTTDATDSGSNGSSGSPDSGDGASGNSTVTSPPPPESTQPPPPSTQPPPPPPVVASPAPTEPSTAGGDAPRECTTNADCPRRVSWDLSKGPSCSPEGRCVQCNADDDCPARGLICSGKCDVCVEHACIACRVDDDCASASSIEGQGPYCIAGSCEVQGKACATDDDCTPAWPICTSGSCPTPTCVNSVCNSGLQGLRKRIFSLY